MSSWPWQQFHEEYGDECNGGVPPEVLLEVIGSLSPNIGLEIGQIMVNPSFLDKIDVPDAILPNVETVTGTQYPEHPFIAIMAKNKGGNRWITHAEMNDNSPHTQQRIQSLVESGWTTGMTINFNNK